MVTAHNNTDKSQAFIRIGEIVKDIQAPTIPTNLVSIKTGNDYQLSWNSSLDDYVVHQYEIYANDKLVKTVLWDSFATIEGLNPAESFTFSVRAKDYQGNYSAMVAGIEALKSGAEFRIFPNPVNEYLQIETNLQHYKLEILSIDGQQLLISNIETNSHLNVSALKPGLYLISLEKGRERYFSKFIKN